MKNVVCALFCCLIGLNSLSKTYAQPTSLAFARAEHLQKGINLSIWYAQTRDHSAAHIETFTTPADFALIKSLGFDHVRVSIDPVPMTAGKRTGSLNPEAIARLDTTLKQLLDAGLNVILDIHPEQDWKDETAKGDDGPALLNAFWMNFAKHFASSDPERVFFEVMNEPNLSDRYRWQGIQARAIAHIREIAPKHTIIATPASWGSMDALLQMEPVRDENVIYTFHYYTPFWFTHQGATWASQEVVSLRGIPYPSSPENVQAMLDQEPDEKARLDLERYGWDHWDAPRIGAEIAAAAEWGRRRGVPLYLGEFGVFREFSKPEMRAKWISDVRTAAEAKHIGWCMWDYQTNFGLVTKSDAGTEVDDGVLHALGLKK